MVQQNSYVAKPALYGLAIAIWDRPAPSTPPNVDRGLLSG